MSGGRQAMRRVLDSGFRPTAVGCVNDLMPVGAMREMHVRGMSVPDDVSVTGFDNIGLAEYATSALTTADVPRETIGRKRDGGRGTAKRNGRAAQADRDRR